MYDSPGKVLQIWNHYQRRVEEGGFEIGGIITFFLNYTMYEFDCIKIELNANHLV